MSEVDVLGVLFTSVPLGAFFHGIYTCILAVALWAIASNKERRTKARNAMVFIIVFLYISTTIFVAVDWSFTQYTFIKNGETVATTIQAATSTSSPWLILHWVSGLTSGLNTIIADAIMIWRCWVVWGGRCGVIVLPTLLLFSQNVFGWLALHDNIYGPTSGDAVKIQSMATQEITWITVYLSLSLGTTLFCTILIIYRIIRVGRSSDSVGAYRGVIEIPVESASLYAFSLIFWMAFLVRNYDVSLYPEVIYVSITGIAPTLIVGRVASGQARPDDSWKSSNVSALQFGAHSVFQSESIPAAEGTLTRSSCHEIKLAEDGLERDDSCDCDSASGSGRRAVVDLERN
ncbi:hypothetical protein DFS33DRAFT_1401797 [Desarmillaria ectypa]|nr:hypothetical protein DFS33DRAFT_1401797 [Desarmillaria ectypa]